MELKIAASFLVFLSIATIYYFGFYRPRYVRKDAEWRASYGLRPESARFMVDFMLGSVLMFAVAFAVTGKIHLAIIAFPGGFLYARWQAGRRLMKRQDLLRSQFIQVIANLTSSLSGGLSPYQALEEITPSLPEPARSVFVGILRQTRAGSGYLDAIREARKATGWGELDLLATALDIYRETGGNLVEVFQYMQESLAGREADRRYVNSLLAQIRMTARVLSVLPFFLVTVARLLSPEFMVPLLDEPVGNVLLLLMVGSVAFGNVIIERMVRGTVG